MEKDQFSIPFGGILSDKFFFLKGRLFLTNTKRTSSRKTRETFEQRCLGVGDDEDTSVAVSKFPNMNPDASNSFERALNHLDKKATTSSKNKTKSIVGCKAVLEYMKRNSSVMAVKDLTKVYQEEVAKFSGITASLSKRMASSELQERFRDNEIDFVIFYMHGNAFALFPKTQNIESIIHQYQKLLPAGVIVNASLNTKLKDIFQDSLEMLTSKNDRDIVRSLFATVTSSSFTAKLQGKF